MFKKILYSLLVLPVAGLLLYLYIHNKNKREVPHDFVTLTPAGWQHLLLLENGQFSNKNLVPATEHVLPLKGTSTKAGLFYRLCRALPIQGAAAAFYPNNSNLFLFQLRGKNTPGSLSSEFHACGFSLSAEQGQAAKLTSSEGSYYLNISRGMLVLGSDNTLPLQAIQRLDEAPTSFSERSKTLLSSVPGDYSFIHMGLQENQDTLIEKIFAEQKTEKTIGFIFGKKSAFNPLRTSGKISLFACLPICVTRAEGYVTEKLAGVSELSRFYFPGFRKPAYACKTNGDSISAVTIQSLLKKTWGDTIKNLCVSYNKNLQLYLLSADSVQLQQIELQCGENLINGNDSIYKKMETGEGTSWQWRVQKLSGEQLSARLSVRTFQNGLPGIRSVVIQTGSYNKLFPVVSPVLFSDSVLQMVAVDTAKSPVYVAAFRNKILAFNAAGKKTWEKNLHGKLLGKLWVIRSKSDGVRIVCNTGDSIFGINPKGENAKGFPVRIPGGTSAPIDVLSNHKEIDYRLCTSGNKGKIFIVKSNGKQLKDFTPDEKLLACGAVYGIYEDDNKSYYFFDKKNALVKLSGKGKVQDIDSTVKNEEQICFAFEKSDDCHLQLLSADNRGNICVHTIPGNKKQYCKSEIKGIRTCRYVGAGRFVVAVGSACYLVNMEGKIEARNMQGLSPERVFERLSGGAFTWFDGVRTSLYASDGKVLSVFSGSSPAKVLRYGSQGFLWLHEGRLFAATF